MKTTFLIFLAILIFPIFVPAQTKPLKEEKTQTQSEKPQEKKSLGVITQENTQKIEKSVVGEIISPINKSKFVDHLMVSGYVKNLPNDRYLWLVNYPEESPRCFPQFKNITIDSKTGFFEAQVNIGGDPEKNHVIKLVHVGYDSHVKFVDFQGSEAMYVGIIEPKDLEEITSVTVVKIANQPFIPYGVTMNGEFFIHSSLVEKSEGNSPCLRSGLSSWDKDIPMELVNQEYYLVRIPLQRPLTQKILYCFKIGDFKFIPQALLDINSDLIEVKDCKDNGNDGHNFSTIPIKELPF